MGGAMVSDKHANFIVNLGNASAEDVEMLIEYIQNQVLTAFGVELQTEVCRVGDAL